MFEKFVSFVSLYGFVATFLFFVLAVIGWGGLNGAAPPTYEMVIATGVLTIAASILHGLYGFLEAIIKMEKLHIELTQIKKELEEFRRNCRT